jgi:hypothetical protein
MFGFRSSVVFVLLIVGIEFPCILKWASVPDRPSSNSVVRVHYLFVVCERKRNHSSCLRPSALSVLQSRRPEDISFGWIIVDVFDPKVIDASLVAPTFPTSRFDGIGVTMTKHLHLPRWKNNTLPTIVLALAPSPCLHESSASCITSCRMLFIEFASN